jgi:hypothetical protein
MGITGWKAYATKKQPRAAVPHLFLCALGVFARNIPSALIAA